MKNKGTWGLFLIVLALAIYAYFGEYKKSIDEQKNKEIETTLIQAKADQINTLTLQTSREQIILSRSTDGWSLESPIKDSADNEAVDEFVGSLTSEKYNDVVKEGEGIVWAEYGLDKPEGSITIKAQDGKESKISVSAKKNFEGNAFIRIEGENRVLVANSNWSTHIQKTAFDFRQKKILRQQASSIDSLQIKNRNGSVSLAMKDGKWIVPTQEKQLLDQNKIRDMLTALNETKAIQIVADSKPSETDLKKYNLDRPDVAITAQIKDKNWNLEIAKDKAGLVYAHTSEPQLLMKLDISAIDKFNQVSADSIRDRNFPFAWKSKAEIHFVEIQDPLKNSSYQFEKGTWKLIPENKEVEVQQDQFKAFFEKTQKLQADRFLSASATFKPDRHLRLKDSEGKIVLQMDWTPPQKMKKADKEINAHLVKTNLSDELMAVDETSIQQLGIVQLSQVKKKAESSTEPKK